MSNVDTTPVKANLFVLSTMLSACIGFGILGGVVMVVLRDASWVLAIACFVTGIGIWLMTAGIKRKSRAAWSFLMATLGTLGIIALFGIPKLATLLSLSQPVTALFPVVFFVTTFLWSRHRI